MSGAAVSTRVQLHSEVMRAVAVLPPGDPKRAELLDLFEVQACEESLRDFVYCAWPILEPKNPYVHGYHIDAICEHLEAVTTGQIIRLLINIPPGFMKSLLTNVFWPAWEWGPRNLPHTKWVAFAYADKLTIRDNRRTRQVITSAWYQERWGHRFQLSADQNTKTRFDNDHTGYKIASSTGGTGTGERGDRLPVDDPNNVKKAESDADREDKIHWFREVLPTRVNDPEKSAIVVTQQRTHTEDISGIILAGEFGYTHLCLPMEFDPRRRCVIDVTGFRDRRDRDGELLWPERFPLHIVKRDQKLLGPYGKAGQHDQMPSPRGGGLFKLSWWNWYRTGKLGRPMGSSDRPSIDLPETFDQVLITCDPKFKDQITSSRVGLFVVGLKWPDLFILEDHTDHMGITRNCDLLEQLYKKNPTSSVLVEQAANGDAILQTLRGRIPNLIAIPNLGGKKAKAQAAKPTIEAGNVYLPEGAPWIEDFCDEFGTFPVGTFKDRVDAICQLIVHVLSDLEGIIRFQQLANL